MNCDGTMPDLPVAGSPPGSSRRAGGYSSVLRLTADEVSLPLFPCPQKFIFWDTTLPAEGDILGQVRAGPLADAPRPFSSCSPAAPRRKMRAAAARRKMALAQKARWAKIKGESEPPAPATAKAPKAKRKLSAAAKAKLVANLKKARAAKAAKAKAAAKK